MRQMAIVPPLSPLFKACTASLLMLVSSHLAAAEPQPFSPVSSAAPASSAAASADSPSSPAYHPSATSALQPCIARDSEGDLLGWADYPHCLVDFRTQSTVRWLDDWFGQSGVDETASATVRAITEMVIDDRGRVTPALRVRARLSLPKISKRLSLVFEDESQDGNRLRSVPTVNEAALALRLLVANMERMQIETDVGVRSGPDLFVRGRLRKSWSLSRDDQFSLRQTLRYGVREKLRAINELDYAHAFNDDTVGMIYHNLDHQQEDDDRGMFWSRGLLVSRMLRPDATVASGFGQEGVTQPAWEANARFVWVRYRQRFLRDWLFYEIEPRLTQTRERDWDTLPSLALRLEVHFGKYPVRVRNRFKPEILEPGEVSTPAQTVPPEQPELPMP